MGSVAQELEGYLKRGEAQAKAVMNDARLSPQAKFDDEGKARGQAIADAKHAAAYHLERARDLTDEAARNLNKAEDDAITKTNWPKLQALQAEAQALASMAPDWQTINGLVEAQARDPEGLRAWKSIGLQVINARSHTDGDKLSLEPQRIVDVRNYIDARQQEVEPPALAKARAAFDTAQANERAVRRDIGDVNGHWGPDGKLALGSGGVFFAELGGVTMFPTAPTITSTVKGEGSSSAASVFSNGGADSGGGAE